MGDRAEPNTWRELLAALDATGEPLQGVRVAVQRSPELLRRKRAS